MTRWSRYLFIVLPILFLLAGIQAVSLTAESDVPALQGVALDASVPPAAVTATTRQVEMHGATESDHLPSPVLDQVAASIAATALDPIAQIAIPTDEDAPTVDCFQMLANSQLDVVDLGDGTGSAEPWVIIDQIVYYPLPPADNFFLFMQDQDTQITDETPFFDAFGQGFNMPSGLESVVIEYDVQTIQSNEDDQIFGELWSIDLDNNTHEVEGFWEIFDWEDENEPWIRDTITVPEELLAPLDGQVIAIVLYTDTDNAGTAEFVLFDNITIEACVESKPVGRQIYLPNVLNIANAGPVCVPPSENPRDEVNANRGLVQTGALCQTTMSQLDTQDYYTFTPQQGGNYTLQLRNLPPNTEWSGSIIQNSGGTFEYAPGPTGGQCRIATPGASNKQVICNLQGGREYVVKVSAGGYSGPEADYEMRVVR